MNAVVAIQPIKSTYDKLPRRLKRFVDQYVIGGTAAGALVGAGYKGRHAHAIAHKWLKRPLLREAIEEATQRHLQDIGVRQQTVLRQMHAIASADVGMLFHEDGRMKAPHELDEMTRAAISAIEVEEVSKEGYEGTRYKYKFWDKVKANDRLGQFVKLWDARSTTVNVDARSVTVNAGHATAEALQQLADITREIAALGAGALAQASDTDRLVLSAPVRDGSAGRGASLDVSADNGDSEQA